MCLFVAVNWRRDATRLAVSGQVEIRCNLYCLQVHSAKFIGVGEKLRRKSRDRTTNEQRKDT